MKIKIIFSIAAALSLSGCLIAPTIKKDAYAETRTASFPKVVQKVYAVSGGIVHMKANYVSAYEYSLVEPLNTNYWLQRLRVPVTEKFRAAAYDGKEVYCSSSMVIVDLITGPFRQACFVLDGGKFTEVMAFPGGATMAKKFDPGLEVTRTEIIIPQGEKILKRELIYEGSQDGVLHFSERIYDNTVDVPSKKKPIAVKAEKTPLSIDVLGVNLSIQDYKYNSITYTLERGW